MSRIYTYPSAPLMISTPRFSSNQLRQPDLVNVDSDSLFLLTLARSNFSVPGTPTTPTTTSTFGSRSSAFPFPPQPAVPRQSRYSLFADPYETSNRGAPVWPAGFAYEEEDEERERHENYIATIRSNSSSGSGLYRGQAVEMHHGTARITTAWMKKTVNKITPKSWRRDKTFRGRMTLD
ncbi:hypothetical protein M407DRAFT_20441 [Tulasnella calospora MUT 4182]|uniref:Uncharacterized protein n=1 Tax=Tulasnella calospora MUT 4182 TaxID=1051891 RepID=A0A0C3L9I3_9AGAM|nr:hypothetical protein M407DRAFT_20441 [Tulasnella calospora MUT 4182]